ncbi:MAG: hypothetical protein J0665_00820 [Deltaproteobacteria bacterium]|jgi:Ni,Fe-hydrogenase I small subunit|nr:hypothetical protein [Deltaproteobacteria bacterium]
MEFIWNGLEESASLRTLAAEPTETSGCNLDLIRSTHKKILYLITQFTKRLFHDVILRVHHAAESADTMLLADYNNFRKQWFADTQILPIVTDCNT